MPPPPPPTPTQKENKKSLKLAQFYLKHFPRPPKHLTVIWYGSGASSRYRSTEISKYLDKIRVSSCAINVMQIYL